MALFDIKMPKLGESIEEGTITRWHIKVNDIVKEDDILFEVSTDKVDSEIPSPVAGKVVKLLFKENDKVNVGTVIAVIETDVNAPIAGSPEIVKEVKTSIEDKNEKIVKQDLKPLSDKNFKQSGRFYSPLVKSISQKEDISESELDSIEGSGVGGRVRKEDVLKFIDVKKEKYPDKTSQVKAPKIISLAGDEIIEMDRMRKLIAEHMVMSKHVSAHVTNFLEVDVTELVHWREKHKDNFEKREGIKITYLPIIAEAIAKALKEFPIVNASVDGNNIILHKAINIGLAVALPNGNLIVPVIKNADQLNLSGLALEMNTMAQKARTNKLTPDDIQGGTFSITNFGSFKNTMGTPIIHQPQVGIIGVGLIQKKPAVLEFPSGDVIAIRHKMYLSFTFDHRIVDGMQGGSFLRKVADYLEQFDIKRTL